MMYLLPSVHFDKRVAYYVKGVLSEIYYRTKILNKKKYYEIKYTAVQYTTEPYRTFWTVLFNPIHYST